MKPVTGPFLLICLTLHLSGAYAFAQPTEAEASLQPKLITPIQPVMPMSLHNTDIQDPRVVSMIQVSGSGKVEDLVILEASHIELVDRAESLIRRALFDPGEIQRDESIRFELILPFLYPSDLGMRDTTTTGDIEIMIDGIKDKDRRVRFHKPGELDETPAVLDRGEIYVPEDEEGKPVPGEAKVEFYVNHMGEVRLPRIISSSDEEMALAAIATIRDMKFHPPTVDGKPAVTRLRMPYATRP